MRAEGGATPEHLPAFLAQQYERVAIRRIVMCRAGARGDSAMTVFEQELRDVGVHRDGEEVWEFDLPRSMFSVQLRRRLRFQFQPRIRRFMHKTTIGEMGPGFGNL